jgi:DNA-binding transcriptional LysR family regulator
VWISPDENTDAFASMNLRASQAGFQPKVAFRINSFPAVLGLVGSGLGVALLPQMALFGNDEVRSIKIAGGLPGRHIVITTSRTHNSPLTKSFVAAAIQVARSTYEFQGTD